MARKPMKPNETRRLKMFMPTLNKICDIELRAQASNPCIMGDGSSRPLLHVEQTTKVDGKPKPEFDIRLWVDADGQVLKQEQDLLGGYVQYRTTKESAKSLDGPMSVRPDQGNGDQGRSQNPQSRTNATGQVSHHLSTKVTYPQVIATDSRQTLRARAKVAIGNHGYQEPGASGRPGGPARGRSSIS